MDLALNNLQRLICHKNQTTNIIYVHTHTYIHHERHTDSMELPDSLAINLLSIAPAKSL